MYIQQTYKLILTTLAPFLLSACIGTSQSLTEEEKENLALLKAVNGETPIKKSTDKSIKVSLLDAHQVEEKPQMTFRLVLNKAASQDISVSINLDTSFTHIDAQAKENADFNLPNLSNVTIPAGQTETQFKVEVIDDNLIEATEQFKLVVSNLNVTDGSVKLLKDYATGTILDNEVWRGPLNDTGIGFGADVNTGNNTNCTGTEIAAQDCSHGFDADPNENNNDDGRLGFSFTKLDKNGNPLPNDASAWSCVKDNRTGLIWEVKTATAKSTKSPYIYNPEYLHDKIWFYSSFDLRYLDGEYEGRNITGKEGLTQEQIYGKDKVYAGNIDIPVYNNGFGLQSTGSNACANKQWVCTTHQYTLDVNQGKGLCGFRDWRIPTALEAETIMDYSGKGMDANFFPHNINFWTKTPFRNYFDIGKPYKKVMRYLYQKNHKYYVSRSLRSYLTYPRTSIRLVRSKKNNIYTPANHGYGNTPKPTHPKQTHNNAIASSTPTSDFEFIPSSDGVLNTVKHLPTGLIWKRCPEQFRLNNKGTKIPEDDTCDYNGSATKYLSPEWQGILASTTAGWRVPNIKELRYIVEYSNHLPSINLVVFPDHYVAECEDKTIRDDLLASSSPQLWLPKEIASSFGYRFYYNIESEHRYKPKTVRGDDPKRCHFTRLVKDN